MKYDMVYLSGKMTGLPDFNVTAFNEAEHYLVNTFGCTVLNPSRHPQCENLTWNYYMELAKIDVKHCDVVVFIEGEYHREGKIVKHSWKKSKGALLELGWSIEFSKKRIKMKELEQ